jgi:hypothetical protein
MKKNLFVAITSIVLFIFTQLNVFACSCPTVGTGTPYPSLDPLTSIHLNNPTDALTSIHLNNSKVAFWGEVIELRKSPKVGVIQVKIEVAESWKEVLPKVVTITTESGGCGYPFQIGNNYLVFATGSSVRNLSTGLCMSNKQRYKATEEIEALGKGIKPIKNRKRLIIKPSKVS